MTFKKYVTARSVTDNTHIFIQCPNTLEAFRTAQRLHNLGEHQYFQIRLRSSKPSLRSYRWIDLVKW